MNQLMSRTHFHLSSSEMANIASVSAIFLHIFLFAEPTEQVTRSTTFRISRSVRHPGSDPWSDSKMSAVDCATLASLAEVDGFNMWMETGSDSFGRCQLIQNINVDDVDTADDYAF